jgi:hypothetical protein
MPAVPGFPRTPEEARICIHGNEVWFGNECGECEDNGEYVWEGTLMPYKNALDYAIFAINTLMSPDASDAGDIDDLERKAALVVATLDDIRTAVKAQ